MKYRPFGHSGLMVSEIGMGTNAVSGYGGGLGYVDETDGIAAVQRAYDLGVTFFDTSEGYSEGRSEVVLGKVLGNKQDVTICTKVENPGPHVRPTDSLTVEQIRPAAEASLRRLNREIIDVYLLHNPPTRVVADPSFKEALEALVRDGLIRTYGVSLNAHLHVSDQIEQGEVLIHEGGYTSLEVGMNIGEQEVEDSFLPHAYQAGVGIIIRTPLGRGLLSGKYGPNHQFPEGDSRGASESLARRLAPVEALRKLSGEAGVSPVHLALGWVLAHVEVSTVIPGCKNVVQVEDNVAAGDVELSPDVMEELRHLRQVLPSDTREVRRS